MWDTGLSWSDEIGPQLCDMKKMGCSSSSPMLINWEIRAIRVKHAPRSSHLTKIKREVNSQRTGRSSSNASMWNTASVASRGGEAFEKIIAWGSVYFR